MKLYNKSVYPDELLTPLLVAAGRAVKARTAEVVVFATSSRPGYLHSYGQAWRCQMFSRRRGEKMHATDGGYIEITVPYPRPPAWVKHSDIATAYAEAHPRDGLRLAELIYNVATHEWQHIRQFQIGYKFDRTKRAKRWANRPWEKDAMKASSKAIASPKDSAQEAILDLALWIEANQ